MMGTRARVLEEDIYDPTCSRDRSSRSSTTQNTAGPCNNPDNLISESSDREYPIKCILNESRRKYLIAWEGQYSPTWEPKGFANRAAVRVWKHKKNKEHTAAKIYQNRRPSRRCKQVKPHSVSTSSQDTSLPATIPDSQSTTKSGNAFASQSTQQSSGERLSQGSSLSGSLFCPDVSSGASQLPGASRTQSQHQSSQSTNGNSIFNSQGSFLPGSNIYSNTLNCLAGDCSVISSALSSLVHISSQSLQYTPRENGSHQTAFSLSDALQSETPSHQGSARHRLLAQSFPGSNELLSRDRTAIVEIDETPPSRRLVEKSPICEQSNSQTASSGTQSAPASIYAATQTPFRTQFSNSSAVQSIPETVYCRSSSSSRLRLLRQLSCPESSPSASYYSQSWNNFFSQPEKFLSQLEDPADPIETMDNSAANDNTQGRPSTAAEHAQNSPGLRLKDRLDALRQAERAKIQPLQSLSSNATPSSAGDIEPSTAPANPATASPLSVRLDKEPAVHETIPKPAEASPVSFVAPQALHYDVEHAAIVPDLATEAEPKLTEASELDVPTASVEEAEETLDRLGADPERPRSAEVTDVRLGPFEFAIPLPMDSRVKDDYDETLKDEWKTITKFLEVSDHEALIESKDQSIVSRLRKIINQLSNICVHPDLNLADPPAVNVNDIAREVSWAEYSSSKFLFLGYFIEAAFNHNLHVIIIVKHGRAVKIMETYFLGKGFSLRVTPSEKADESEMVFYRESLSFGIRTTSDQRLIEYSMPPALIIAMDSSFDVDSEPVRQVRATVIPGQLVPVVRLVIANTAEHMQICLPDCSDLMKLRLLIKYIYENMVFNNVGELQDDALGVQEDAEEILDYLTAEPTSRKWPLATIEALVVEIPKDTSPSKLEPEELRSMTSSRQKRWLESEEDETTTPSKRQRMTPLQDITHISDSMKGQTQDTNVESGALEDLPRDNLNGGLTREIEKLRLALADAQSRLKTTESNLAAVQHRYETKHKVLHKTRQDLDAALEGAKKSALRIEKQRDEILKLKEEKAALKEQLEEARNIIKEGGGTPAELEKSQEESRRLAAENEKLERTANQESSQLEYTRQQYQNASSAAAQSGLELRQREEEIQELKRKASDEASRLKKLKIDNDKKSDLARIEELETALATRDLLLTKKDEELNEIKKNRPTTRATSLQPRSPKWGPSRPTSPGPSSNSVPRASSALRFRAEA